MGLLLVGTARSGKPFVMDDQHLLDAVAAQTGTALLNARLSREASEGQAFQAVAQMSTFVAHDLKNSATALTMLAKNTEQFVGDPEFQRDLVRNLRQIAGRIGRLLSTLTSPERVEAAPRRLNLGRSADTWVRELLPQLPTRIQVKLESGETGDILADPEQLRSVLHNLVMNAVEATPEEGTIEVSTRQEGERSVLAVADTGRGMSREFIRTRLFQPFQTTKARGLGIGLYQCRQIIHAAGGSLTVESEEGRGSVFLVKLPVVGTAGSRQLAAGSEPEKEEPAGRGQQAAN
jgi:putative PEP-CTERM system histidine kinase